MVRYIDTGSLPTPDPDKYVSVNSTPQEGRMKEDCYYYYEIQDMSARVPTCTHYDKYGYCPCGEKCWWYISRNDARKVIDTFVERRERR